ncbi:hypothetical protein F4556_003404 [Kitasatospora gansuensis]|uniref:Uncharacterized protein n=1 Tax=Kitasatospora gansuensis TaxID=258050 RepID=A0A7W7SCC9_9ACTN|nr:hypothetical protein [Kitasatospora gansuensis]MBB4947869.1 hypothetical protein [Kitasatospora gansuensis]
MIVSASLTVVLTGSGVLLIRGRRVSLPTALVLWLSGFTLAQTGIQGPINSAISAVVGLLPLN